MQKRTICPLIVLVVLAIFLSPVTICGADPRGNDPGIANVAQMPEPGRKVPVGSGYYLIYGFDKKPKLGTAIMKVEIFNEEGGKDTSLEVLGDADMPSMRGAHATGDRPFRLSRKGDYLLPIPIVMPGQWEVTVTVVKGGKAIFRGRHLFNV
jgi:hypothetical protein